MSSPADPDVETLLALAAEHREACRYGEARVLYERAVAREERQPVLTLLGAIQNKLRDQAAAIPTLERSLALAPDDDEAHFHLGLALRDTDAQAALTHFERAIALDGAPASYHRETALTLWKLQRFDEALRAVQDALACDPGDAFAHHTLGHIQEARGELDASTGAHLAAAALESDCGLFWASAARVTARTGNDAEAERLFHRALAAEVDSAIVCRH
jgi:tetratricopeptide (TPR) repeat protein